MAETTGGQRYPEPTRPEPQTLQNSHDRDRNHGQANGTLRGLARQFRRFRNQCHHHQIRADHGYVLKPKAQ